MIFYLADPHFDYEQVLLSANRPFSSVKEMNEQIVRNWNSVVSDTDTVYLIGDLSGHGQPIPEKYLARLKGRKHLIRGNHDTGLEEQERLFHYFESVTDFLEIDDRDIHVVLCHYPVVYNQRGYMIHGHLHSTKKDLYDILRQLPRVMNACVDINRYRPVTLEELIVNNQNFYHMPGRGEIEPWLRKGTGKWKADFRPLPRKHEDGISAAKDK